MQSVMEAELGDSVFKIGSSPRQPHSSMDVADLPVGAFLCCVKSTEDSHPSVGC